MSILAGEKFQLKLLPSNFVELHEECEDNRCNRLVTRFVEEKVLYNPLIVARFDDKFILIDGANRFEALKRIDCKAILAQLVDYKSPGVKLKSWYHFVSGMTMAELEYYASQNGLIFSIMPNAINPDKQQDASSGRLLSGHKNGLVVLSVNGEKASITLSENIEEMLISLSKLNRYYENKFSYTRIDSDTDISDVSSLSPDDGLLFVFPDLEKKDIITISGLKQKLPAGISRHMIPNRVLHIKILIDALKSDENIDKKNEELEKYVQYKIDTKKVRLYREPILVFDE